MATHSSTLAWKIPWMESLVDYSPCGHKELDTTERLHLLTYRRQRVSPLQCQNKCLHKEFLKLALQSNIINTNW